MIFYFFFHKLTQLCFFSVNTALVQNLFGLTDCLVLSHFSSSVSLWLFKKALVKDKGLFRDFLKSNLSFIPLSEYLEEHTKHFFKCYELQKVCYSSICISRTCSLFLNFLTCAKSERFWKWTYCTPTAGLFYLKKGWKPLPKLYKVEITNDKILTIFVSLVHIGASPVFFFFFCLLCNAIHSLRAGKCMCECVFVCITVAKPNSRQYTMCALDKGFYSFT